MQSVKETCAVCSASSTLICGGCNSVHYCSKQHQKNHWLSHKESCHPYIIQSNHVFGRYLVACRNIKQGELILKEFPTVIGPSIQSAPLCTNCYKPISKKNIDSCQKCKVAPYCDISCNGTGHSEQECKELQNLNITMQNLLDNYQILLPLRCLFLKKFETTKWKSLIEMEAHIEKRRNSPIWLSHKFNIEDILLSLNIITEDDIEMEIVQKICGILDVNTFELRSPIFQCNQIANPADCIRGIYLKAALMAHDCTSNTHLAVDDSYNLIVHASVPILKGSPIYFNYTNALKGTYERQEHLKEGKYFICMCERCVDPTECGIYMSSLKCIKCHKGLITPENLIEDIRKSVWKCSEINCSYEYKGYMISSTISESKNKIEDIDKSDIFSIEYLLRKLLITFPSEHSIIIDLKQRLSELYSNILHMNPNPSSDILKRKLQLCNDLLSIIERVEPGISRLKGLTNYEMHLPMVVLANREYENNQISADTLLKKLTDAEGVLKKAISFLVYEPGASPEGRLAIRAIKELKMLRGSISSAEDLVKSMKKRKQNTKNKKQYM